MRHTEHVPGSRTINYDIPPHRCPRCNHVCNNRRYRDADPSQFGRPPETQQKLVEILREAGGFVPLEELATHLGIKRQSLPVIVYRARRNGAPIEYRYARGYRLGVKEPHNGTAR